MDSGVKPWLYTMADINQLQFDIMFLMRWAGVVGIVGKISAGHKVRSSILGSTKIWNDLCDFLSHLS